MREPCAIFEQLCDNFVTDLKQNDVVTGTSPEINRRAVDFYSSRNNLPTVMESSAVQTSEEARAGRAGVALFRSPTPPALRATPDGSARSLRSRLFAHDTEKTTCPPAPLVSGGPLIIVPSLMRSGTHLLLDSLFNNFPMLRRTPLFVDFDAYQRQALPSEPLNFLTAVTIKTHFPETPLAEPYASRLASLASRALILMPRRTASDIRRSMEKWGMEFSPDEFAEVERRFQNFWAPFSPLIVDFPALLDPARLRLFLGLVAERAGLDFKENKNPCMPARHRWGVYFDKALTRVFGRKAPRINTTIGYRLSPRQRA